MWHVAFPADGPFISSRVRALGETDLNPVSGLGKISQLLFAVIQPGNVVANIIAGGVAEAGAQQYVGDAISKCTMFENLRQGRGSHARFEDRSSRGSFSESTVLRTTYWVDAFYSSHGNCFHAIQQGISNPRPHLSRTDGLRLAQPREVTS